MKLSVKQLYVYIKESHRKLSPLLPIMNTERRGRHRSCAGAGRFPEHQSLALSASTETGGPCAPKEGQITPNDILYGRLKPGH